ncbi:LamG domain-containing protein [Bdellovibrio sp. HCB288]|uniref:LamG domain-containing protein n=1 Tax=Bdellovibrio sp. HCB288 TaxID=3394355 RepID=UPI0039B48BFA
MTKWLLMTLFPLAAQAQMGLLTGAMQDSGTGGGRCVAAYRSAWIPQNNSVAAIWHMDGTVGAVANSSDLPSGFTGGPTLTATMAGSNLSYANSSVTALKQMITGNGNASDIIKTTNTTDLADLPALTVSMWVNMAFPSGNNQRLFYKSDDNSSRGYFFVFRTDGSLDFRKVHSSSNMERQSCPLSSAYWASKTWHHLVVTWDGTSNYTGLKYYLDGTEVVHTGSDPRLTGTCTNQALYGGYATGANGGGGFNQDTGYPFILFGKPASTGSNPNSNSLTGSMDEVVIWNKALTGAEVTTLYKHQKCN